MLESCAVGVVHVRHRLDQRLHEGIEYGLVHQHVIGGNAHLTGVAEFLRDDHVERLFKVAIVEDQHRRVAAELHRHALHVLPGERPDFLPETREVRESDWTVAPIPQDLLERAGEAEQDATGGKPDFI